MGLTKKTFKTAGSDQGSIELMREMGSKKGFDPIPPDQHAWQMSDDQPPLHRIWSYLCSKTIRHGHRSAHAVDSEGRDISVERIATDLKMDEANVRFTVKRGIALGLWRMGTKQEGPRRIYLCGEVKPFGVLLEGEDKEKEKVCANLLPPYILKQIKDWPSDKREKFLAEEKAERELENLIRADLDAARRLLITERQDTRYEAYGVKKIREEHPPKKIAPEAAARDQRVQSLLPILAPAVKRFAQTFSAEVCANAKSACAQTVPSLLLYSEVTENTFTEENPTTTKGRAAAPDEKAVVVEAIHPWGLIGPEAAGKLIEECRKKAPDASLSQITEAIRSLGSTLSGDLRNPVGVIIRRLPGTLVSLQKRAAQSTPRQASRLTADHREALERTLHDVHATEEEKQWAREGLAADKNGHSRRSSPEELDVLQEKLREIAEVRS